MVPQGTNQQAKARFRSNEHQQRPTMRDLLDPLVSIGANALFLPGGSPLL